jgi:hypothetical protein
MLPKWHILFGAIFSLLIYFVFQTTLFEISLVFLSSFLFDVDHYMFGVVRNKTFNLKELYFWHKGLGRKHKPILHIFHSVEFIIFLGILAYFFNMFLFILIGLIFHTILDLIDLFLVKALRSREFSLIRFTILRRKSPKKYF